MYAEWAMNPDTLALISNVRLINLNAIPANAIHSDIPSVTLNSSID